MYAILGCGSVGVNVARLLVERQNKVLIIDKDEKRVENLREQGFDAIVGDIRFIDPKVQRLSEADAVLILSSDINANLESLRNIRASLGDVYTIVRALDLASVRRMKEAKADYIIQESDVIARSVVRELEAFETKRSADNLIEIIKFAGENGLGIFVHNNPDPDALASALALRKICENCNIKSTIYFGGDITHQKNRALVNLLDIELKRLGESDEVMEIINSYGKIALIDSPKPGSNNVLPKDVVPNIIIDHHSVDKETVNADFLDIRSNFGSTSTIMTKYLQQLDVNVDSKLATALLYGIRSDTKGFTRNTTTSDLNAAAFLSPLADKELLRKVESPPMSPETLDIMGKAIANREIKGSYLLSCVEIIRDRDALPQSAEFLLSLEGVNTVLVYGIVNDEIIISARSDDVRMNLGDVLKRAFGSSMKGIETTNGIDYASAGGHASAAGAQIPLGLLGDVDDKEMLVNLVKNAIKKQFFSVVGVEEKVKEMPKEEMSEEEKEKLKKDYENALQMFFE